MPFLKLAKLNAIGKAEAKNKDLEAIAIVKSEQKEKNKLHNSFLYLDRSDKNGTTNINLPLDCYFELIPTPVPKKRQIWYICGPSGVGKSYLAVQIAKNYQKLYNDRKIFLVSKLEHDDTIDRIEGIIKLDHKDWVENPPDINKLKNSLIIFDDIDSIGGAEGKALDTFVDDIATMGRSHTENQGGVSMIYISHAITSYKKTRILLLESHFKILFPMATNPHSLYYIMSKYIGLKRDEIAKLKKIGGRFVAINCWYPNYMISKYSAKLLHQD